MDSFLSDSLELTSNESLLIFEILEETEKSIDSFIKIRSQAYKEKYGDEYLSYIYDPEAYIFLGESKLAARKKIEKLIGRESYTQLYDFIQNYNQGKYSDSAVPIDF